MKIKKKMEGKAANQVNSWKQKNILSGFMLMFMDDDADAA